MYVARRYTPGLGFNEAGDATIGKCNGGETAANDPNWCCSTSTWNNLTYRNLKGESSWRRLNEDRVHHLFALLLGPDGSGSGLGTAAYDLQATVPAELIAKIKGARRSMLALFPWSRWQTGPGVQTACQEDGYYNTWVAGPVSPGAGRDTEYNYAMSRLFEGKWSYAQIDNVAGFVINRVPSSEPGRKAKDMPTLEADMHKIVQNKGGVLVPTEWFAQFLLYLNPTPITVKLPWNPKLQLDKIAKGIFDAQKPQRDPTPSPAPTATGDGDGVPTWVIVAGAVVVVGGGALAYRHYKS